MPSADRLTCKEHFCVHSLAMFHVDNRKNGTDWRGRKLWEKNVEGVPCDLITSVLCVRAKLFHQ